MKLRPLRKRLTPNQLRRRAARLARRSGKTATAPAPMPIVVTKPPSRWSWREQTKLDRLRTMLSGAYSPRYIRARVADLREHLMKVVEASRIERCRCGGRIRENRMRRQGRLTIERFCALCGREAYA